MKRQPKVKKKDQIEVLYTHTVHSVLTHGFTSAEAKLAVWQYIDLVIVKPNTIVPLHTSEDIQTQVYLKLWDWLSPEGKHVGKESQILHPASIRKLAGSFGFSGAKYPVQVCRLENWTPLEHLACDEEKPPEYSPLLAEWLKYQHLLDTVSLSIINPK